MGVGFPDPLEPQRVDTMTAPTSPFTRAPIGGRLFKIGDHLRLRGHDMVVVYLDGKGGMVVRGPAIAAQPRRYRKGTAIFARGVRFTSLFIQGEYMTLRRG